MRFIDRISDIFFRLNLNYERGRKWYGVVFAPVAIMTMLGVYRESKYVSWFFDLPVISTVCLFLFVISGFVFVGWVDKKLKIRNKEIKESQKYNDQFMEVLNSVRQIKDKLDEKSEKDSATSDAPRKG